MKQADGRLHAQIGQIKVKLGQVFRHAQAFIDNGAVGQAANIKIIVLDAFFNAAARHKQASLDILNAPAAGRIDKHLLDFRHIGRRNRAEHRHTHRHIAPSGNAQGFVNQLFIDNVDIFLRQSFVLRQENLADGKVLRQGEARFGRHRLKKGFRHLQQQAAAVARFAVRQNGAAVLHARQTENGGAHHFMARLAVDIGDKAETAVFFFQRAIIQLRHDKTFPAKTILVEALPAALVVKILAYLRAPEAILY